MASKKNEIYVEKHPEGYAVLRPNAERASAILPTQAKAIAAAEKLAPNAAIHVERVRTTDKGHPDQWRKL